MGAVAYATSGANPAPCSRAGICRSDAAASMSGCICARLDGPARMSVPGSDDSGIWDDGGGGDKVPGMGNALWPGTLMYPCAMPAPSPSRVFSWRMVGLCFLVAVIRFMISASMSLSLSSSSSSSSSFPLSFSLPCVCQCLSVREARVLVLEIRHHETTTRLISPKPPDQPANQSLHSPPPRRAPVSAPHALCTRPKLARRAMGWRPLHHNTWGRRQGAEGSCACLEHYDIVGELTLAHLPCLDVLSHCTRVAVSFPRSARNTGGAISFEGVWTSGRSRISPSNSISLPQRPSLKIRATLGVMIVPKT